MDSIVHRDCKTVKKTLNSIHEIKSELMELSKLDIIAHLGRFTKRQYFISIGKPGAIEVRIYTITRKEYYSKFKQSVENKDFKI